LEQFGTRRTFARTLRTIIGVMAVGFLGLFLFCAGGGVLLVWGAQRAVVHVASEIAEAQRQHQLQMVRVTTSAFVHELSIGDTESAYGRLSRAFRERESLREWQEELRLNPMGKGLNDAKLQVNSLDSADVVSCRVILVTGGGFEVGAVLDFVKEDRRWAVDRLVVH